MELGLYTFADLTPDPATGRAVSPAERLRQVIDLAALADGAGLDVVGVGEHHGADFANSATAVTLAAMAQATRRVRLTSAVTLLSTADPVRTFQEFATLDLISGGRAEVVFGRGAYSESFPLFGFDLGDYDALFAEKLALFDQINAEARVTWSGRFRPGLRDASIAPRPVQPRLPVWIGAGSPASVERAARLGYPLALPMIGGGIAGAARTAGDYRAARAAHGLPEAGARVAVYSHLHVAEGGEADALYSHYAAYLRPVIGRTLPRDAYEQMLAPGGALVGGSPQQVVDKLMALCEATGATRYVGQIDAGGQDHRAVLRGVELFAAKVAPHLRGPEMPTRSPTQQSSPATPDRGLVEPARGLPRGAASGRCAMRAAEPRTSS